SRPAALVRGPPAPPAPADPARERRDETVAEDPVPDRRDEAVAQDPVPDRWDEAVAQDPVPDRWDETVAQDPARDRRDETVAESRTEPVPAEGRDDAARAVADFVGLADSGDVDEMSDERIRTLIWTAATYRPLEEVAALVTMLKRSRAVSSPADEALRAAAVARPLEEVRQLVAMLNEAGHPIDESDTTLRAAAVGRPIEDVVQLVSILGTAQSAPAEAPVAGGAAGRTAPAPAAEPVPAAAVAPEPAAEPAAPAAQHLAAATAAPAVQVPEDPKVRPPRSMTAAAAQPEPAAPASGESAARRHSALRWPAAVALLVCGAVHLPVELAGLRAGSGALVSLVVTALCMVAAVVLVMRESPRAWMAAAMTAVGVFLVHTVAGDEAPLLLERSVGAAFTWSGTAALVASVLVVLLAGKVLLRQRSEVRPAGDA
ncbi:hypothetical protein, partial [Streptomyces solincola]|uniref:hypothetical protein n=1 Tax=Streptomyces solincola TaxID=2100817 RepID=UPI001C612B9B